MKNIYYKIKRGETIDLKMNYIKTFFNPFDDSNKYICIENDVHDIPYNIDELVNQLNYIKELGYTYTTIDPYGEAIEFMPSLINIASQDEINDFIMKSETMKYNANKITLKMKEEELAKMKDQIKKYEEKYK